MRCRLLVVMAIWLSAVGCGEPGKDAAVSAPTPERRASVDRPSGEKAPESPTPPATGELPRLVFLGDSLTAGLGVAEPDAFPALLGQRLAAMGIAAEVVNAGVSGDTTAGGLERLDWVLQLKPEVLIVGLGANDGLRGLPLEETETNLRRIVQGGRAQGAELLLLGMLLPPNYGPEYSRGFAAIYPRLAAELEVPLVPFLLEGVGGEAAMNQADGIHPNEQGHRRTAENVLPYLVEVLQRAPP